MPASDAMQPARDVTGTSDSHLTSVGDRELSKLAHELRTPLSAISAASDIMHRQELGSFDEKKYREYAQDIHESAQFALTLIDRILAPVADAHSADNQSRDPVDISSVVERCLSAMRPLAKKAGIDIKTQPLTEQPHIQILADETSLKQILLNLIFNAIKYTQQGGCIEVRTRAHVDDTFSIFVSDTGPGMSADAFARALEGENVGNGARDATGGLGLGLPLVKSLCEANDAQVSLAEPQLSGTSIDVRFRRDNVIYRDRRP